MKGKMVLMLCVLFVTGAGCAKKEVIKPEAQAPAVEAQATEAPTPAPEKQAAAKYDVKKGDSLWKIASGSAAYGDPFEWPLIYKANRDQIQDPDIIEANQQLEISKDFPQADVDKAVQDAKATPPYRKHAKPRATLPLKY